MNTQHRVDPARIWLAVLLLLALGLRVYRLDGQSLWYDEAVTAQVASQGISELTRWTADDIQPPLYYYIVAGWTRLAGSSEWALRFPSVFFSVLMVALLWDAARRLLAGGAIGRWAAGITALLATLSPLYIYYAQEARMYTLLAFLGVLAGYALLQTTESGRETSAGWWLTFVLAAAAMLYTHYFGVFLLLAYGVCWLVWRSLTACARKTRSLAAFGVSVLAIILLYLPWLPAMLNRYRVDASYWQGKLKLGEALRHLAISFAVAAPEMMLEEVAVRLLPFFAAILVVAVAMLFWRQRHTGAVLVLLATLVIPVVAVLLLASRTPKFNPRYLMLASPAYLLLIAGGFSALCQREAFSQHARRNTQHTTARGLPLGRYALTLALIGFLVTSSLVSTHNWFADSAFTKAQWRELVAFVRQERRTDETVLLVSGHAYPVWDYYAADIPAIRLPPADILDVNTVLGFETGPILDQALNSKHGAWLVTWQEEVVDPVGFVPYFLDRGGREQLVERQFWHLGLRHWQLMPDAIYPAEPQPQHTDGANFDHKLALLGWDDPVDGQITVYWRVLNTLLRDYQVSVVVEDAAGARIGRWDGRPAGYDYPTFRWRPGQELFGRYPLPISSAQAMGEYYVTLTIYDVTDPAGLDIRDIADNPAGKRVRLGPVSLK